MGNATPKSVPFRPDYPCFYEKKRAVFDQLRFLIEPK